MYNVDNKLNEALEIAKIKHKMKNNDIAEKMNKSKQAISNLLKQDNYTLDTLDNLLDILDYDLQIAFIDRRGNDNITVAVTPKGIDEKSE